MLPFNPFSQLTSKIYGAIAIAALAFAGVQTLRIEGLKIWPLAIPGFKQDVADRTAERDAEVNAHKLTKFNYRQAQEQAVELERQRLERVAAEQQEITDEVVADYRRRIADARATVEQLRAQRGATRDAARGAADDLGVPATGDTAGGPAAAPADPRLPTDQLERDLIATEQALQLDALITWVLGQAGVSPND